MRGMDWGYSRESTPTGFNPVTGPYTNLPTGMNTSQGAVGSPGSGLTSTIPTTTQSAPTPAATPAPSRPATSPAAPAPTSSPWIPTVTSTLMDNSTQTFATPGNPNINYITPEAAADIARRYGGNLVQSGNVMGGSVSSPMFGIDLGFGDPISAGQIAFMEARGDSPEQIRNYMRGTPAWSTNTVNPDIIRNDDTNWIFSSPLARNLPQGGINPLVQNQATRFLGVPTMPTGAPQTPQAPQVPHVPQPTSTNQAWGSNMNYQNLLSLLMSALMGGGGRQIAARRPSLPQNRSLLNTFYYPRSEPRLY